MKSLFWNIRGIANRPSRLDLKRLLRNHKHHFLFIVKSKISFDKFPINWFQNLGFKFFAANNSSLPSLWCFCKLDINSTLLASSNKFVAFSFDLDRKVLASTAVYASNNMYQRKFLWDELSNLLVLQSLP